MVREDRPRGRQCEWVGGDGVYGQDSKFRDGLPDAGARELLDMHADDAVSRSPPHPDIPKRQGPRGRPPTRDQVDDTESTPMEVRPIVEKRAPSEWKQFSSRVGTKGALTRQVLVKPVGTWKGAAAAPRRELLLISRPVDGSDLPYSVRNRTLDGPPVRGYALWGRQLQRDWVARSFEDAKRAVGMDE
jgi:hypothetical protein